EAMFKIGPDVLPPPSRQARIQQYYCELPDGKLKFVDLVLYFQDEAISVTETGGLGLLNIIENVEPAFS
ncbi:MAG: hypothetical protein CMM28_15840, partial [Rhodospirillaceae bacterium]|nr:hypothetical protein [Rhodospirillaceae bacterium]